MRLIFAFAVLAFLAGCSTIREPYFFSAEKGGRKAWVLGTVHQGISVSELPSAVLSELRGSSAAYFEVDMRRIPDPESETYEQDLRKFSETVWYVDEDEATLDKRLPAEYWERFVAKNRKWTPDQLKELSPQGAVGMFAEEYEIEVSEYQARLMRPQASMDYKLEAEARNMKIPVFELDEAGTEGRRSPVCKDETDKFFVGELKRILDGGGAKDEDLLGMLEAYRNSNDSVMKELIGREGFDKTCLLKKRNESWASKIDRYLNRAVHPGKQIFVAVGVGHLLSGPHPSLLDQLISKGYNIQRWSGR